MKHSSALILEIMQQPVQISFLVVILVKSEIPYTRGGDAICYHRLRDLWVIAGTINEFYSKIIPFIQLEE